MNHILVKKVFFLLLSIVAAMVALNLIGGLINDRFSYQEEAKNNVSNSWSGEQQIIGPILIVPYSYPKVASYSDMDSDGQSPEWARQNGKSQEEEYLYIIPEQLNMTTEMVTQSRAKGIFSFPVYTAMIKVSGEFDLSPLENLKVNDVAVKIGTPYIGVSVGDIRGINNRPKLAWQGSEYNFQAGSRLPFSSPGIHAALPELFGSNSAFSFSLSVRGMDTLWFTPVGKETSVKLDATWPHPNFKGQFLPTTHTIDEGSFQAEWLVSEFSTDIIQNVRDAQYGAKESLLGNRFGVQLNTPVDVYRQSSRSIKYGILFVGLTFASFFIFEMLKKLQIHPVQYTLISISLALFYLLLIAFSETFGFKIAYILATTACVSLLTFYVCSILKSRKWGLGFGAFITVLYTLLYVILRSEDHSLLLGSTLVFAALCVVMITTRNLDWYKVPLSTESGQRPNQPRQPKDDGPQN